MPEAVQSFVEEKDFHEVREIQKRILAAYEQDFSKHASVQMVPKIRIRLYDWSASVYLPCWMAMIYSLNAKVR